MDFSETIEIKVMDRVETYSVDSYFFAYFYDLPAALEQIRDAVRASRNIAIGSSPSPVIDTTISRSATVPSTPADRTPLVTSPEALRPKSPSYTSRLSSLLRPLQETLPLSRTISAPDPLLKNATHTSRNEAIRRSSR